MIAIVAANFAAVRACFFADVPARAIPLLLLGGLLPLANIVLISLYALSKRYRISLRRQPQARRAAWFARFTAVAGLELMALVLASLLAPFQVYILGYAEVVAAQLEPWANSFTGDREWIIQFAILPLFLGIVLSGPPVIFAHALAWVSSWFELVVVPSGRPTGQIQG